MKVVAPKPFTYDGGKQAVLFLHGFTGNTAHVRALGRFLQKKGFTCHAPLYKGHGEGPEALLNTNPTDWWEDALQGYQFLKREGYQDIFVVGLSLGAIFSLKMGKELPVKGIVSMSAPIQGKTADSLRQRVLDYAYAYMKLENDNREEIHKEIMMLQQQPLTLLDNIREMIEQTSKKLDNVSVPTFVIQGCLDEQLYIQSAKVIYDTIRTENKKLSWYDQSGHIITVGKEKGKLHEDIYQFLTSIE